MGAPLAAGRIYLRCRVPWRNPPAATVRRGALRITLGVWARASVTVKRDVFPTTQRTWIDRVMDRSDTDRGEINRHIMAVYSAPLRVYFLGTGSRWLGDPEEIVAGFFADRLARDGFLRDWRRGELRLRRWLVNAFSFYLAELRRKRRRDRRVDGPMPDVSAGGPTPERMADRAFSQSIVAEAIRTAEAVCAADGLQDHWGVFIRHTCDEVPYADLAADYGVTSARAAVMARTAARHFRKALRALLVCDGAGEDAVEEEIRELLEAVER